MGHCPQASWKECSWVRNEGAAAWPQPWRSSFPLEAGKGVGEQAGEGAQMGILRGRDSRHHGSQVRTSI